MSKAKLLIAIVLLVIAFFGNDKLNSIFDAIKNSINKEKVVSVEPRPDQADIDSTKALSDLITDKNDKARLAVFNYEFANRVPNYKVTAQQLIDIYTSAGKLVFQGEFADKYPSYGSSLTKVFLDIVGEEEHVLTQEELVSIQKKFNAISWNLSQ